MVSIFLYDKRLQPIGPLNHVIELSYSLKHNELSTATITMPQGDAENARITEGETFASIRDGGRDIGIFRFGDIPKDEQKRGGVVEYSLKSAECTLLDDLMVDWHEIGGTGIVTREVLEYILQRQTVKRWQLGTVGYSDQYQYNFEDVTLLEAIMSLGEVIVGDYAFRFDTSSYPWTLNFVPAETGDSGAALVYGRNVRGITRSVDATVVNRLYGRGYGEGDNQLTIKSVNGGKDYLDADGVEDSYDVRCGVHVDRRQTDPALLKARMAVILDMGKKPRVSYEVDAIDYYRSTGQAVDHIRVGYMVSVLNAVTGDVDRVRVVQEDHSAAIGDPGQVKYTLSSGRADTADALNEVLEKIGVQELYSQGATNMYSMQLSDNADASHPLVMRFYVPGNVLRINSCLVYWDLQRFRTYTTLAKSGGGSTQTSKEGGGATVSTPKTMVSTAGNTGGPLKDETNSGIYTDINTAALVTESAGGHKHTQEAHAHNMNGHKHASSSSGPDPAVTVSLAPTINIGGAHTHDIKSHTHKHDHFHLATVTVTIPPMDFKLTPHSHSVTIPAHTHELEYGVYESNRADRVTLKVDGTSVPASVTDGKEELDVAKYLRKDSNGRVTRGTWHEVEFVPDGLTRITADLFFQVFIQSRGAGDY